ncbi:FtsX-like permease family protein [Sphingobacterium spiritivorum]|uniref:FtsX-like permease family protein n=1 Tax=Sphingobacterium spiritivorum TaxID=258 RepID=UPI003DA6A4E4
MNLSYFFAKRYLFSKKSVNAINIISMISVIGVLVSSAALVIVLSFYNGMEKLILSMFSTFSPELRIEPAEGKLFSTKNQLFEELRKSKDIKSYSEVLEEKALLQFGNHQFIGKLKGIEPNSLHQHASDSMLYAGEFEIFKEDVSYAIIGANVQANLQIPIVGLRNTMLINSPRKGSTNAVNPADDIIQRGISPRGVLKYQQGFDDLVITPIDFARDALGEYDKVSAIEMYTRLPEKLAEIEKQIQDKLGKDFKVLNREEQNPTLYKTVSTEKWAVFFILTFIGIIAIFNIIGSMTMLVIDKRQDMIILKSLGAENTLIQRIFYNEGMLIALIGSISGIIIGYAFCFLQDTFGFIRTGEGNNSIIDAYPVDIRLSDFLLVFLTVLLASVLISYLSSLLSVKAIGDLKAESGE